MTFDPEQKCFFQQISLLIPASFVSPAPLHNLTRPKKKDCSAETRREDLGGPGSEIVHILVHMIEQNGLSLDTNISKPHLYNFFFIYKNGGPFFQSLPFLWQNDLFLSLLISRTFTKKNFFYHKGGNPRAGLFHYRWVVLMDSGLRDRVRGSSSRRCLGIADCGLRIAGHVGNFFFFKYKLKIRSTCRRRRGVLDYGNIKI